MVASPSCRTTTIRPRMVAPSRRGRTTRRVRRLGAALDASSLPVRDRACGLPVGVRRAPASSANAMPVDRGPTPASSRLGLEDRIPDPDRAVRLAVTTGLPTPPRERGRRHPVACPARTNSSSPVSTWETRAVPSFPVVTTCSPSALNATCESVGVSRGGRLQPPVARPPDAPVPSVLALATSSPSGLKATATALPACSRQRMDSPPALPRPDAHRVVGATRQDAAVVGRDRRRPSAAMRIRVQRPPARQSTRRTPSGSITAATRSHPRRSPPRARRSRRRPSTRRPPSDQRTRPSRPVTSAVPSSANDASRRPSARRVVSTTLASRPASRRRRRRRSPRRARRRQRRSRAPAHRLDDARTRDSSSARRSAARSDSLGTVAPPRARAGG